MSDKHSILLIDTPDDFATTIDNDNCDIDQVSLFASTRNKPPRPFYEYNVIVFSPYFAAPVKGNWDPDDAIVNNLIRDLDLLCSRAGVSPFTLHDLRRSCITNWARKLPIQTVQHLAGHSNIETTRKYYLSVQQDDLAVARELQSKLMAPLTNYGAK